MLECHPDLGRLLQRVAALLTIQPFCPPTEHLPNAVRLQHEGMEFWNLPVGLFCLTTHSCFKVKLNHLLTQATEKKKKRLMKSRKLKMRFHYGFLQNLFSI